MRSDEVERDTISSIAELRISAVIGVFALVVFILPALIAIARQDLELHEPPVLIVDPAKLRTAMWPRLMEECMSREPEYVCLVKVRDAVEAALRLGKTLGEGVEEQR